MKPMPGRMKAFVGVVIIIALAILGAWYWQASVTQQVVPSTSENTALKERLLGTAWVQLDENSNKTDEEIDFRNTKENDPSHTYYDYQEYLHHRPGESGYWAAGTSTIMVIGNPSDIAPIQYIDVTIVEDILNVVDSSDGTTIKFERIIN